MLGAGISVFFISMLVRTSPGRPSSTSAWGSTGPFAAFFFFCMRRLPAATTLLTRLKQPSDSIFLVCCSYLVFVVELRESAPNPGAQVSHFPHPMQRLATFGHCLPLVLKGLAPFYIPLPGGGGAAPPPRRRVLGLATVGSQVHESV